MPWFYFTYSCAHPGRVLAPTVPIGRVVDKCAGCEARTRRQYAAALRPLKLPDLAKAP